MCTSVFNEALGEVDTIGDLRAMTGLEPYWLDGYAQPIPDTVCLCPVDVPATLFAAGFKVWKDPDGDPCVYLCERVI